MSDSSRSSHTVRREVAVRSSMWPRTTDALRAAGHGVIWAGDWARDPGDRAILEAAHRDSRVLVTLDKDFGELAIRYNLPHSGIRRLVETPVVEQAVLCEQVFERHGAELFAGALITADLERIRVRPASG